MPYPFPSDKQKLPCVVEELFPVLRVSNGDEGFDPVLERAALQNGDAVFRDDGIGV